MSANDEYRLRGTEWHRFLERLGLYLLLGPGVAWITSLLLWVLLNGLPSGRPAIGSDVLLLMMILYLMALPIAGLYASFVALALRKWRRIGVWQVALAAGVVSLVLYLPALILGAPSDGQSTGGLYWRTFAFVFLPALVAGLSCWGIAPAIHKGDG